MRLTDIQIAEGSKTETNTVCLIGMALDGPVATPFFIQPDSEPLTILGDCQMAKLYHSVEQSGVDREHIQIFRLNGRHGTINLFKEDELYLTFKTIGASDTDQNLSIEIGYESLIIRKSIYEDDEFSHFETRTFTYADFHYLNELVDSINHEAQLGIIEVVCQSSLNSPINECFKEQNVYYFSDVFSEGSYCIGEQWTASHQENYWEKFEELLIVSEEEPFAVASLNIQADILLFSDCYFDSFPEIGEAVGLFASILSQEQNRYVTAIMNTSTIPGELEIPAWYYSLGDGQYMTEAGPQYIDTYQEITDYLDRLELLSMTEGRKEKHMDHLQVVVGDAYYQAEKIPISGFYAGTYAMTPQCQSVTNQTLKIDAFGEEISKSSLAILRTNGYICCVPSIRKHCVPLYAQSFRLQTDKTIKNLHVLRGLSEIQEGLTHLLSDWVGQFYYTDISKDVKEMLDEWLSLFDSKGLIESYDTAVECDVLGREIHIQISLKLFHELTSLMLSTTIKEGEGVYIRGLY